MVNGKWLMINYKFLQNYPEYRVTVPNKRIIPILVDENSIPFHIGKKK